MLETEIHWQDSRGTVSTWVDSMTREITNTIGQPNPGHELEWAKEVERLMGEPYLFENDPILLKFRDEDRLTAAKIKMWRLKHQTYQQISNTTGLDVSTIKRWCAKMGMVKHRKK